MPFTDVLESYSRAPSFENRKNVLEAVQHALAHGNQKLISQAIVVLQKMVRDDRFHSKEIEEDQYQWMSYQVIGALDDSSSSLNEEQKQELLKVKWGKMSRRSRSGNKFYIFFGPTTGFALIILQSGMGHEWKFSSSRFDFMFNSPFHRKQWYQSRCASNFRSNHLGILQGSQQNLGGRKFQRCHGFISISWFQNGGYSQVRPFQMTE